jgi:energy-coupling factor transport system permease protein
MNARAMNARAVAAWSLAALTISLSSGNPVYRLLVLLAALNVLIAYRRSGAHVKPIVVAVVFSGVIALLITSLFSHTGTDSLVSLPAGVPGIGGHITLEAVVFGFHTALGIASAVFAAAALSTVIAPHELVDALPPFLARTGAALGTSLNFVPSIARSAGGIRDAQRLRGWRPGRLRDWPDLAVPVVLSALEDSLALAEAMEARGYGATARTHFLAARWTRNDTLVASLSAAGAAAFVVLRIAGAVTDWYPFPTLSVPPVNIAAVACCLTLASPLVLWRR